MRLRAGTRLRPMAERVRGMTAAAAWNPGRLPGTPREWLAGPDWCFTDVAGTIPAGDTDAVAAWVDRWQGTLWSEADPLKRLVLRDLGGGRWVLRSDGVNDGIGHGPATTGARTIAMSYTQTVSAAGTRVLNSTTANSCAGPRRLGPTSFVIGADSGSIRSTVFADDADPHVYVMARSGSGPWRAWSDTTSLAVSDVTNNFGSLGVGAFTGAASTQTWTGDIYSVVDTAADISDADRAALTTYLARLYGGSL